MNQDLQKISKNQLKPPVKPKMTSSLVRDVFKSPISISKPFDSSIPIIKTIRWIPDEAEHLYADFKASGVTLAAYAPTNMPDTKTQDEKTPQTNEWVAYLPVTSSDAIRIEAIPYGYKEKKAFILLQREFELMDPTVIKTVHISTNRKPTISSLVRLIQDNGYDKYQFLDNGIGCRWWMYSFITLLHDNGIFDHKDEYKEAVQVLKSVWQSQDVPVRSENQTSLESSAGQFPEKAPLKGNISRD